MRKKLHFFPVKHGNGFTLIEVMITIAIVGILSTIALPSFSQYLDRARLMQAQSDIIETAQAAERFYTVNRTYDMAGLTITPNNTDYALNYTDQVVDGVDGAGYLITAFYNNKPSFGIRISEANVTDVTTDGGVTWVEAEWPKNVPN